jgi:hypothetical protein
MALKCHYRNGYVRYYEGSNDRTVSVITGGPSIVSRFDCEEGQLWKANAVNSSTQAVSSAGVCTITTGGADDDDHEMTSELIFDPSKGLTAECRFCNDDVDKLAWNFGFSDAVTEAADKLAVTYATATLTSNATDCALFFSDPDATTNAIRCVSVKGDVDGTIHSVATLPADSEYHTCAVEIDADGSVRYYWDGALVFTDTAGITTTATLCAYFGVINREGAANTAKLDYFNAWQWRV